MDSQAIVDKLYKARWCYFVFVIIALEPVLQLLYLQSANGLTDLGVQVLVASIISFITLLIHWIYRMSVISRGRMVIQQPLMRSENDQTIIAN